MDPNAKTRVSEQKPDPFVGRTADGYRIDSVIGRGGMGTVYKAHQLSLGRPVAIKILPKDLAEQEQFLERFHREADALSRLAHPNVVTVFDRGEIDGQPYLVMEFVEGMSLREVVRGGPLPAPEALRIVSSVLAALEHAHRNDIVHRDIKPENVLLAQGDIVKVADFGLSRLLGPAGATRLTRTQLVLGTYEYMAPEQREHSKEADPRSDLYATGVVLYEMLTGELPIGRFEMPSSRRPQECDGRVDELIERSLDKNPEQRYQHAIDMADAVSAILERPDIEPLPPAPPRGQVSYRPVRFEYHIDNLATIDHVLGTIFYVIGFTSLFGIGLLEHAVLMGVPSILFIVGGWYLRSTADGLRKFKDSARTAQAVIALITFFLLPFSIYSLWVLFSHRGRTYFAARGRGLEPEAAARQTYRMMEEPYAATPAPPPPRPAPAPPVPHPSQIPVQSMVTSEVQHRPVVRRRSGFVSTGLWTLFSSFLTLIAVAIFAPDVLKWVAVPAVVGFGLLVVGFFHSLVTPGVKGALAAFFALFFFGIVGVCSVYLLARVDPPQNFPSLAELQAEFLSDEHRIRLGSYRASPPREFEREFFREPERTKWLRDVTGHRGPMPKMRLARHGKVLYLELRVIDPAHVPAFRYAVLAAIQKVQAFEPTLAVPQEYAARFAANPPPG